VVAWSAAPRLRTLSHPHADRDRRHLSYDYFRYEGRDWRFFEPVYARMRPAPPVLDVGSGLGLFVECCQRHGTPAVGLELSKEGVEASGKRRLSVVRGDLTLTFPFRDNVFGAALAHHVLEHLPPAQVRWVLREIRRVLRPAGLLFVASPNTFDPKSRDDPDHINLFAPHGLKKELLAAGFRNVNLAPNYWRSIWEPYIPLGRAGAMLAGALWKIVPFDRFAGSSAAFAWK